LERVRGAWDECQADRRRDAIYGYLKAVYDLVSWWSAEGYEVDRARQAVRSRGLLPLPREDAYAAMFRCTTDPARADKRTRSKWSRVLRYAAIYKDDAEPLARFVKRKGGRRAKSGGSEGTGLSSSWCKIPNCASSTKKDQTEPNHCS
jgi:hypothetical protein